MKKFAPTFIIVFSLILTLFSPLNLSYSKQLPTNTSQKITKLYTPIRQFSIKKNKQIKVPIKVYGNNINIKPKSIKIKTRAQKKSLLKVKKITKKKSYFYLTLKAGVKKGKTKIKVSIKSKKITLKVYITNTNVKPKKPKVKLSKNKIYKNKYSYVKIIKKGKAKYSKPKNFVSKNKNIAKVDNFGRIKGISKGTTTIKFKWQKKKRSAKITVLENTPIPPKPTPSPTPSPSPTPTTKCTVNFYSETDKKPYYSTETDYNTPVESPTDKPIKTGYTFLYWHLTNTDKPFDFKNTKITTGTDLYASYSDVYQVTVINGTGSGEYEADATVNITADEKDGYTFTDWTSTDTNVQQELNGQGANATFTMPNNNVTLTANYKEVYTIHYDLNGGTGTTPPTQSDIPVGSPFIAADIPSDVTKGTSQKDVYWNTQTDGLLQNDILQNSTNNQGAQKGQTITLYLQWANKKMQDFTNSDCQNLNQNQDIRLYDTRNNQIYQVRKLADGKCWMVNNLKLDSKTLNYEDTNTVSDWTLPPQKKEGSSNVNDIQVWGPIIKTNPTTITDYYTDTDHNSNHFGGNLYNYQAATGNASASSGDALNDICPKNWRMPTKTDMSNLPGISLDSPSYLTPTDKFAGVFSGFFSYDGFSSQFSFGRYWSSTVLSGNNAYGLDFYSSTANVYNYSKLGGLAVRCLVK
jgi:uncharacterized protein (TIGR02145 family)/uncharacterized repeat protein (TIGR02543 family)